MRPELQDVSEFYSNRIGSKEREIKRLRAYVAQIESSEKRLSEEFAEQIREKNEELKRLAGMLKAAEARGLSKIKSVEGEEFYKKRLDSKERELGLLKGQVERLKASLEMKEIVNKKSTEKLAEQIKAKSREMEKLRVTEQLRSKAHEEGIAANYGKKAENENELDRLRGYVLELENSEKRISAEYSEQLAEKERQIRRLVNMLKLREESNRLLSEKLDAKVRTERDYVDRIKNAISRKEEFNREVIEKLTSDIALKNNEADRLRDVEARQERLIKRLEGEVSEYQKRQDRLEAFLYEKDSTKHKLEKNFAQQLKNKEYEIERLGEELKKQFDSKPAAKNHEEASALRIKLQAKDEEIAELAQKFTSLKEQNGIAMKRLDERQKLFVESENTYNKLINSLQLQHEKRVKELMHSNSQREVELKTEIERLKAGQKEREMLLAEKESRIDETLLQFSETSRRLLELKESEGSADVEETPVRLREKEAYIINKEAEIGKLLKEADERIKEAVRKEQEVARKEELLLKEQEAVNAELSILKNAGVEVQRDKEYLKAKIKEYETPKQESKGQTTTFGEGVAFEAPEEAGEIQPEQAEVEAPMAAEPVEEAPEEEVGEKEEILEILRRPGKAEVAEEELIPELPAEPKAKAKTIVKKLVFKQTKSRVRQLPKPPIRSIRAKVDRLKIRDALIRQAEKKEAFPEVGGYGEIHEIESIIDIGLQHGDSIEQIRSSLEASGYSKQSIEKAFKLVKKS